jgi:ribosomal protein L9
LTIWPPSWRIQTGAHIKAVGDYTVSVQLHDDVSANVNIQVRAAK